MQSRRAPALAIRVVALLATVAASGCGNSSTAPSPSTTVSSTSTPTTVQPTTVQPTTVQSTTATSVPSTTATSTPSTVLPTTASGLSSLTYTVTDSCNDGRGLQIKFFDTTNNGVWPSANEVYLVPVGQTRTTTLSCRTGAQICYGARTDPASNIVWGLDLDRSRGCDNCCTTCQNGSRTLPLSCS